MSAYKRAEQMWSQKFAPGTDICSEIAACIEAAVAEERSAIVAWLRAEAEASAQTFTLQAGQWANRIDGLADDIARGEHRREEKEE